MHSSWRLTFVLKLLFFGCGWFRRSGTILSSSHLSKCTLDTSYSFCCRPVMALLDFMAKYDVSGSAAAVRIEV